ncbi:hypothetical protein [Lactococcus lactis]|uniref:hypothetical protein n=1 Tax=Lactococcus lactis TaxID=1358 RepID=UPI003D183091
MTKNKIKNSIGIIILIFLTISIFAKSGILKELDEIAAIISIMVLLIAFITSNLSKSIFKILILSFLLILCGLLSNLISGINRSFFSILVDILTVCKPFWIFGAMLYLVSNEALHFIRQKFVFLIKSLIFITYIFFILNELSLIHMSNGYLLFNIPNFKFVFGFPVAFAIFLFVCLGVLINDEKNIINQPWVLSIIFLILATGKMQSYIFIVIFLGLVALRSSYKKRLQPRRIVLIGLLGILISLPKIFNYFLTDAYSPRRLMMFDSFNLLIKYFPLGSGFATFGSPMASKDYSPIYYQLGYQYLYGLQPSGNQYNFLNDNWGSSVIGQFGVAGLLIFILLVFTILKLLLIEKNTTNSNLYVLSGFMGIISIIFSSSFFTSSEGGLLMAMIAIVFSGNSINKDNSFSNNISYTSN